MCKTVPKIEKTEKIPKILFLSYFKEISLQQELSTPPGLKIQGGYTAV